MRLNRPAIAFFTAAMLLPSALSVPALAQTAAPSSFERAMLAELNAETRAEVERRAVNGNSVMGVIGTILLNNYQAGGARRPGEALSVVAVDFSRGVAVIQRASNVFELRRFDPKTLNLLR